MRAGRSLSNRLSNFIKNEIAAADDEVVRKPQNAPALRPQPSVASAVVETLVGRVVRRTIQLDDQARGDTDEIGDVGAKGNLPAKFRALAAIAQAAP